MKFSLVGDCFQKLEQTSSRTAMTELLAELFKKAAPGELSIMCNLSLGQLNPPYIGTQFNIATALMTKVVAKLLDVSEATVAAHAKKQGDLGSVAEEGTWRTSADLTVNQVYKALHAIERLGGSGSQEEKIHQLTHLLKSLDPQSAKFVIRIILGKLRLGFSDMTIVDALSWMEAGDKSLRDDIENAYNICADIGLIAQTLKEGGIAAVKKMHATVGIPIRPAAAERLPTAKAIVEKLGHCIAQPKLDGFRLQIHLDKTHTYKKLHFYSRNLQDMSNMFPDLVDEIEKLDVQTLICEGEAIVYDRATGSFLPFQETVKRKRKHDIEEVAQDLPLQVFIFDVLYLNGKDLLDKTHEERRKILLHLFKGLRTEVVQPIEEKKITTAKELEDYFNQNIAAGLEGLVVKRPDAIYQPGKRNFNWIKLKRQEEGHLEDTIDCVILGYYAGEGKRATFGIGAFLVGVYNKKTDRFETIAKIGTGLKDHDWVELKKKCDKIKVADKPKNVACAKDLYPDVWTSPEIVVLIRADEITMSPVHAAGKTEETLGYALRFPRFMGYRPDKSSLEATTVDEVKGLFKDQFKK
ncbi:MAG TPA: ATP-dependent DNA ligase [Candidatus Limnocylindria bacterium]|nr:ATP-dependent DNA ligase [Candidatus Limnocylindria bacterium]